MRFFSLVSVLPAVDDRQLTPCVEKQHIAQTGKESLVLLIWTDSKKLFSHNQTAFSIMTSTVQHQYSYAEVRL